MTSNNFNDDDKLKDMFEAASADSDKLADKEPSKDDSKKKAILTAVGVMVGFGVLLGAGALMLRPQEFEDKTEAPTWVDTQVEKVEKSEEYNMWDFEYPVEVPEWTKQPFTRDMAEDEEMIDVFNEFSESFAAYNASISWMPSGVEDEFTPTYTSNIEEQYMDDNTLNPYFSYTLREDYVFAYSTYINRLINPVFGNWVFAQMHYPSAPMIDNTEFEKLSDMFSRGWWDENVVPAQNYSALPVLADWEGDNFGGLEFTEDDSIHGTFFGVVNETEDNRVIVESLGIDERGSEILKIDTPILYAAFDIDGELIKKEGVLSLTLASNDEPIEANRVVIINVELISDIVI